MATFISQNKERGRLVRVIHGFELADEPSALQLDYVHVHFT